MLRHTLVIAAMADSPSCSRAPFGTLPNGAVIEAFTLSNAHGVSATILTYGATLQALIAPDREGRSADIIVGYDDLQSFVDHPNYYGAVVGRYANRIARGRFSLDGMAYTLAANNAPNSLHGGLRGFDKVVWRVVAVSDGPVPSVTLGYTSADGEEGYPGALEVTATYSLDDSGALGLAFEATTDRPTIVNLTNHAYFNLAGEGSPGGALGHRLTIPAARYTPVDATLIPTGEQAPVDGTVFDFRAGRIVADGVRDGRDPQIGFGRGYDHNFVLDAGITADPKLAARLEDPVSGRVLEVLTTEPGLQVYSGNFLDGTVAGKNGHLYRMGDAIVLEPQKFPDSPNQPNFPSARLDRGETYRHEMVFRVSVARYRMPRPSPACRAGMHRRRGAAG